MKNLVKKIAAFLKKLTGKAFGLLRDNAALAVSVTAKLKDLVESKAAGTLVDLIPGEADNAALEVLRKILPKVSYKLGVLFGALAEGQTDADAVAAIIEKLKEVSPESRGAGANDLHGTKSREVLSVYRRFKYPKAALRKGQLFF